MKIAALPTDDVTKLCSNLELALQSDDDSSTHIEGTDLVTELQRFSHLLPAKMDALQTLPFTYEKKTFSGLS
jgi:hypothetical protein